MAAPVTKRPFWRMFATALVSYMASVTLWSVAVTQDLFLPTVAIGIVIAFGLWALKAPRAAAIGVIVIAGIATAKDVRFLVDQRPSRGNGTRVRAQPALVAVASAPPWVTMRG